MIDQIDRLRKAIGGTRFILAVGCGLVTSALLWFDKLDGGSYTTVILGTVGAYIAGRSYEKRNVQPG